MGENNYAPLVGDNYAPEKIRVIIPVGGKATRLLPLTAETSKACLRLLNRPLVEFSLLSLANQGIRHFIFGVKGYTNYRDLYDYFESGYGFSARYNIKPRIHIKYQPNVEDLGSADSARINMDYYDINNPVFAVQGDNIFDINVKDLIRFHKEKGATMTIVLREVENVEGFGIADIDKNNRIRCFVEKPLPKDAPSNLANTGLYVISPEVKKIFKEKGIKQIIEEKNRLDFGYDFIPYLTQTDRPVYGYTLKGNWFDVGTPKNYLEAMKNLLHGGFSMLTDFGGRISEKKPIWVQGESNDSEKRRQEIIQKIKQGKIRNRRRRSHRKTLPNRRWRKNSQLLHRQLHQNRQRRRHRKLRSHGPSHNRRKSRSHRQHHRQTHHSPFNSAETDKNMHGLSHRRRRHHRRRHARLKRTKIYPHQNVRGEFQNQTLMTS